MRGTRPRWRAPNKTVWGELTPSMHDDDGTALGPKTTVTRETEK
jgi:hypothetical protein